MTILAKTDILKEEILDGVTTIMKYKNNLSLIKHKLFFIIKNSVINVLLIWFLINNVKIVPNLAIKFVNLFINTNHVNTQSISFNPLPSKYVLLSILSFTLFYILNRIEVKKNYKKVIYNIAKIIITCFVLLLTAEYITGYEKIAVCILIIHSTYYISSIIRLSNNKVFKLISLNYYDRLYDAINASSICTIIYSYTDSTRFTLYFVLLYVFVFRCIMTLIRNYLMYLEVKEEENAYVVFDCCDVFDDFTKLITYKYKVSLFESAINENRIDFPLQSKGLSFPLKNHLEKKDGIIYISYDMSKIVEIKNIIYIPIVRESQLSYIEKDKEEEFFNLINELSNKNKIQKFVTLFYFDKHKIDELYTRIILESKLRPIKHNLYNEIKTDEDYNNYLNIKEKVKYLEEKGIFKLEGIKKSIFENFNSVNIMYSSIAINEYIVHYLFNYYFKDINYANKEQCIYNPSTGEMLEILKQNRKIIKRNSNISIVENNKSLLKTFKENDINFVVNEKYDKLSSPFLTLKQFNALRNAVFRHGLMSSHIIKEISFTLINVSLDMLEYFEYELLNEDNKWNEGINYNGFNLFVKNTTNDSIMLLSKIDNDNKAEYIDYKYGFINIYKNNKDVLEYCNNSISTGETTI